MAPRRSTRRHPETHTSEQGAGMARRRSPHRHPHIHASESGAGMARRRGPRLHPQIHASEDGAGVARRRSPRLRPAIHSREEGAGVNRRTGTSPAASLPLPVDDDMLREILLRLPPQPSSLPRASAVCKRWRGLVTDPRFHRQFHAHHRKPPLLGYFHISGEGIVLNSVLPPPDRIPPQHFDLRFYSLLDCRHGRVLTQDGKQIVVCDLVTRVHHRVSIPRELIMKGAMVGAVLCAAAAAAADHIHGSCHLSPFKVVLVSMIGSHCQVYSSETGLWGNLISTEATCRIFLKPAVLVGNCLHWLSLIDGILEFDLDENSLTVTGLPPGALYIIYDETCQLIEAANGAIGFAQLSYPRFQLSERNINAHGVATWVPWKTIELDNIPRLPPQIEGEMAWLLGYDEDTDVLFLHARGSFYRVQLRLMQSMKLNETHYGDYYYPFKSFYTPGTTIAGEFGGAEMLHDA